MSVIIKLRDNKSLPQAENEIRKYILKHPKEILDMSVYDLAKKTYTSPATVVRLCKRFDVKGYSDLKLRLASEIKSFDELHLPILDSTIIHKNDTEVTIVDKITNIAIESIEETRLLVDLEKMQTAVKYLSECQILDLYGVGAGNIVAMDAMYKFMRVGKNVACYQLYDRQLVQAINSDDKHLAIIFSYSGETKEIIQIVNQLQNNGTNIIAVTSTANSSLSKMSDINLYVSTRETIFRSGAMASRMSSLYIVDMLYALFCSENYDNVNKIISRTRIINNETK